MKLRGHDQLGKNNNPGFARPHRPATFDLSIRAAPRGLEGRLIVTLRPADTVPLYMQTPWPQKGLDVHNTPKERASRADRG